MKLIYFSEQTLPKQKGGGNKLPRVCFNKAGTITFNPQACELMELKVGDKITLAQDEEDTANWYFFKDNDHGFALRSGYDKRGTLFNHSILVKEFLNAFEMDVAVSHNFIIAGEPTIMKTDKSKTKYWGVIVKQAL